jgi:hypothetical protein
MCSGHSTLVSDLDFAAGLHETFLWLVAGIPGLPSAFSDQVIPYWMTF